MNTSIETICSTSASVSYLLRGDRFAIEAEFRKQSKQREVFVYSYINCSIEDVRIVIQAHTTKSLAQRTIVISFYTIGIEVQNALLKFLEEPGAMTTISLVTYPETELLPTIYFRVQSIDIKSGESDIMQPVLEYLGTLPIERSKVAFYKKLLVEKYPGTDKINKEKVQRFLQLAVTTFAAKASPEVIVASKTKLERSLSLLIRLRQSSASIKNISEYITLSLPKL
jgi:DNA polymerase III, delta subunit